MKFIILILSFFLFSVSSYSQDNSESNVEFTSDSLEVDENKNLMIAKGNVVIKSEKEIIKADSVKYDKSPLFRAGPAGYPNHWRGNRQGFSNEDVLRSQDERNDRFALFHRSNR